MASPEERVRNIATFAIVVSGMFLLAGLAAWNRSGPLIGELSRFMDVMNRMVVLPCGIVGLVAGVGLLRRWNWGRMVTIGICGITSVLAFLLLIGMLVMPLGAEPGESKAGLLLLKTVCLLFIALPVVVPIFWIKFLTSAEAVALFRNRPSETAEKRE